MLRNTKLLLFYVLLAMLLALTNGVAAGEWMPGLRSVSWVAVIGLLAGMALAHSNFPGWTAHLTSWMYGSFVIAVAAGLNADLISTNIGWRSRIFAISGRMADWISEAWRGGISSDRLPFYLIVAALAWLFGYVAAWYTFRHRQPWHVILPIGLTLFCNVYYYSGKNAMEPYLAVFLVAMLVLLVHSFISQREEQWGEQRIRYAGNLRSTLSYASVAFGGIAMLLAWQLPNLVESRSAQEFFNAMQQPYSAVQQRAGKLFSGITNYALRPSESFEGSMKLDGPRDLPQDPVMTVVADPQFRHYWRARSLDNYDGRSWANTVSTVIEAEPNNSIGITGYQSRTQLVVQFALARGTDTLYTSGQPLNGSLPMQYLINGTRANVNEIVQARFSTPLVAGSGFASVGSVSMADIDRLRRAPTTYPAWVTQRYLQIPTAVPASVRAQAAEIVRGSNTPFEKALAIERWLRTNITYDETINAPPAGEEGSAYLLRIKRGYCTYYSTAMVMMLRAQGVPARVAEGYAEGNREFTEPNGGSSSYIVRQIDRHAWVEVFIPTFGWINFEPTAGQAPISRNSEPPPPTPTPSANSPTATPAVTPTPAAPPPTATPAPGEPQSAPAQPPPASGLLGMVQELLTILAVIVPVLLGLAILFVAGYYGLRYAEQRGFTLLMPVARAYAVLSRWATWLGIGAANTPLEQATALARQAPGAAGSVRNITDIYIKEKFAPAAGKAAEADNHALQDLALALKQLRLSWLLRKLGLRK